MPTDLASQLSALAHTFAVNPASPAPLAGNTISLTLGGPISRLGLSVSEETIATKMTPSLIDFQWLIKDVRFENPEIESRLMTDKLLGGIPIADLGLPNAASLTTGNTSPPGVPGLIGRLGGSFQLPMQVTDVVEHPVKVEVRWRVFDEQNKILSTSDVNWSATDQTGQVNTIAGTGGDVPAQVPNPKFQTSQLDLAFSVVFVDATTDAPTTVQRSVQAGVRLTSDTGVTSDWVDLPAVPISMPTIPVPTILCLFENAGFSGRVLILVPSNSSIDDLGGGSLIFGAPASPTAPATGPLFLTLATILTSFGLGGGTPGLLTFLAGTGAALATLASSSTVFFRKADSISNLDDLAYPSAGRVTGEDLFSSLIFIGPPRRQAQCFNTRNFVPNEGQMNITADTLLFASVASLASATPVSFPAGRVSVPSTPKGSRWFLHGIVDFNDELSSIAFV